MPSGEKVKKITVLVPADLTDWMDGKIRKRRFASYSHAIVNALQEMKDRDQEDTGGQPQPPIASRSVMHRRRILTTSPA